MHTGERRKALTGGRLGWIRKLGASMGLRVEPRDLMGLSFHQKLQGLQSESALTSMRILFHGGFR